MTSVVIRRASLSLILPLAALVGCAERASQQERVQPFVFRSLNLRQQDSQGRLAWTLTSPEARYDLSRRLAQARGLQGVIYRAGKPAYALRASSGTVLNDGEVIQLEGEASLEQLGGQPVVIRAQRVRWLPRRGLMELDLQPEALDRQLRLTAQRARFLIAADKLELRGAPTLERYSRPLAKSPTPRQGATPERTTPEFVLVASRADWFPRSGALQAAGLIRSQRRGEQGQPPQTLTSPSLSGNTLRQQLSLSAPVRFRDPGRRAWMDAGVTEILLASRRVESAVPFQGQVGQLQVRGRGFRLLLDQQTAVITEGCRLQQPGEALQAERCRWNWQSQAVRAVGAVQLRRQANQQLTQADRLDGRLGGDGLAVFTSPGGGRVHSQVVVPPARQGQPQEQPVQRRSPIAL